MDSEFCVFGITFKEIRFTHNFGKQSEMTLFWGLKCKLKDDKILQKVKLYADVM